jgi:hypothetical protein
MSLSIQHLYRIVSNHTLVVILVEGQWYHTEVKRNLKWWWWWWCWWWGCCCKWWWWWWWWGWWGWGVVLSGGGSGGVSGTVVARVSSLAYPRVSCVVGLREVATAVAVKARAFSILL